MSSRLNTNHPLPESEDVPYTEPPKSIALYVDATKWIVGLATGSFLLTGPVLANQPEQLLMRILAGFAIFSMAAAAGLGVRALQCYTRLANLFEVHAAKKAFDVEMRNNGYEDVRWVTDERLGRTKQIAQWLTRSNTSYERMTWCFGIGLLLYVLYGGLYMAHYKRSISVNFSPAAAPDGPVLGIIHDPASKSDCVVVRSNSVVTCQPLLSK